MARMRKYIDQWVLLTPLLFVLLYSVAGHAKCTSFGEGEFAILDHERIGALSYGMTEKALVLALGSPMRVKYDESEVQGKFSYLWYPSGVEVEISLDDNPPAVAMLRIKAPSQLKTSRGIGVGSGLTDVQQQYGCVKNHEDSTPSYFVAGSIYGGVMFEMKEGKVQSIFIGAAAD